MTTPSFQFFEGQQTINNSIARITVRKGGVLVLTQAAIDMLGDGVAAVQVGYDPDRKAVGVRAAAEDVAGAYKLREQKSGAARMVNGKRLFALHGLTVDAAESFDVEAFGGGVIGFRFDMAA